MAGGLMGLADSEARGGHCVRIDSHDDGSGGWDCGGDVTYG